MDQSRPSDALLPGGSDDRCRASRSVTERRVLVGEARVPRLWVAGPVDELREACATGLPEAIVTNPDVLATWFRGNARAPEQTAADLAAETGLPIFVQLSGPDRDAFLRQANAIQKVDSRLIPKLPATAGGFAVAARLSADLPILMAGVATLSQAAAAAAAGARFLCPYFARLREGGIDPAAFCREASALFSRLGCSTELVPASIRTVGDLELALSSGSTGVIVFTGLFRELLEHPTTRQALDGFGPAWDTLPDGILRS